MNEPIIKKNHWSLLWLLPLLALGAGLYLTYQRLSSVGENITINFKTAEGLEAKKTQIRYRNLDVGTVTDISLGDDLKTIVVKAQMNKTADRLLTKDAKFWVVKPQISAAGITGLNTIISGSYIALEPGTSEEQSDTFAGIENPPLTNSSEPGVRIHLTSNSVNGINVGSPVYYRGFRAGTVEQIKFNENFNKINIDVFINAPYDKLINNNTKFWNASGFDFKFSPRGADVSVQSMETLFLGGISFTNQNMLVDQKGALDPNKKFMLYASEDNINDPSNITNQYYILYFQGDPSGLADGAPVLFDGIQVGEVRDIRLIYDTKRKKTIVPVLISITPQWIYPAGEKEDKDNQPNYTQLIPNLVKDGLHASLETDNLFTGSKKIVLKLLPDDVGELRQDLYSDYQILPSISGGGFNQIAESVGDIVNTVKNLPLEPLVKHLDSAVQSIASAAQTPGIQNLGASLQKTLDQLQQTSGNANLTIQQLNQELRSLSSQLQETMYGMSPDSSMYYKLQETLNTVQQTANSFNQLMQTLNKKPNALILGK